MKAMLLRVGIDKSCGGSLGPIFPDGTFEYVPIPELKFETKERRTYKNIMGRKNRPLSDYLPSKIQDYPLHFDPEFTTFTYGDTNTKGRSLLKLSKDDLLIFYAGLTPHDQDTGSDSYRQDIRSYRQKEYLSALYIIGYFTVKTVVDFKRLSKNEIQKYSKLYANNAHIKRKTEMEDLVMVLGDEERSRLLDKVILISEPRLNKIGRTYHAGSREMEKLLNIKGSIQRSIPVRFIEDQDSLSNLRKILNLN